MIKQLTLVIILLCLFVNGASAVVPPYIKSYVDDESNVITEDGLLPGDTWRSLDFARYGNSNWQKCVENFSEIAPDARRQSLLVVAGEFLPPSEYLLFINSLCQLRQDNKLSPEIMCFILRAAMVKSNFLAYNYSDPNVALLIDKIESHVVKDFPNQWEDFFQYLKSGEMRKSVIQKHRQNGDKMPESISNWDNRPYQMLMGGDIVSDLQFAVTQPLNAVFSLSSKNRNNSRLIIIYSCFIFIASLFLFKILKKKRQKGIELSDSPL